MKTAIYLLLILFPFCALAEDFHKQEGIKMNANLPGAKEFDSEVIAQFEKRKAALGKDYKPRTSHLNPDGSAKYTNRLFLETSPYLLQHAHNPVNWLPWGDETFALAKKLDRPVFLSIGYSTCHWCHVMEEESFEDEEIARYLNENYISIKVDREERPDVDAIYMAAVQAISGGGGWPMSVWLTTDKKPYYGGTYFPPRDGARGANIGFLTILQKLKDAYLNDNERVVESSSHLAKEIAARLRAESGEKIPTEATLHAAAKYYAQAFDKEEGGANYAPKFPSSFANRFLLRYARRSGNKEISQMVEFTLQKMYAGGMYDQVAGGFHRYSTDKEWLVPHFEKMLYDNALLAVVYLEAYQYTSNNSFERVVREILRYVERDMTSPQGGFYSATDADSLKPDGHRDEGYFFTWTPKELVEVLTKEEAQFTVDYYQVTDSGNFEGRNILHTSASLAEVAKSLKISESQGKSLLEAVKEKLYQARLLRPLPIRDEKILTSWNGLMISAYAKSALVLNDSHYLDIAKRAAQFVLTGLYQDGRLQRSFNVGKSQGNGFLDDYAFFIAALIDLYEATSDAAWLDRAIELDKTLENYFEDKVDGAFFMTSDDHEELLAREKPAYDGAEPSGNSIAVFNLLRLNELITNDTYRARAVKALQAMSGTLERSPMALSEMLLALDFYLDKPKEIIIVAPKGKIDEAEPLLSVFRKTFIPNRVFSFTEEGASLIPILSGKTSIGGKVTAYVCKQGVCKLPTIDAKAFAEQLAEVEKLKH